LAVPAVFITLAGLPFNTAAACAFVAVSGMTVNAAVLCAGGLERAVKQMKANNGLRPYLSLRHNLPALAATTITTIAGAIPFLFLTEGANVLIRTMALVTVLGVGCSCLCAVSILPAMIMLMQKNPLERKKFSI
jgi:Cu/Ag efflux pump CusA